MWNRSKSLVLSKVLIIVIATLGVAICVGLPWIANILIKYSGADLGGKYIYLLITGYSLSLPAFFTLFELYKLLKNIEEDEVFIPENVAHLRHISWYCMVAAFICFASTFYYPSFLVLFIMSAFIGIILRVVKNVLAQAVKIKEENDYTI